MASLPITDSDKTLTRDKKASSSYAVLCCDVPALAGNSADSSKGIRGAIGTCGLGLNAAPSPADESLDFSGSACSSHP